MTAPDGPFRLAETVVNRARRKGLDIMIRSTALLSVLPFWMALLPSALAEPALTAEARECPSFEGARLVALSPDRFREEWDWVVSDVGLDPDTSVPAVCLVQGITLAELRAAGEALPVGPFDVLGIYHAGTGTVLLSESWSGGTGGARSILIHEFSHHAQSVLDRRHACPGEAEAEAFDLQERWLAERGTTLGDALGIDPLARILLSHCAL